MDPDDTLPPPTAPSTLPAPPLVLQAEELGLLPDPSTDPLMRGYPLHWNLDAPELEDE
jgi:hypothetical protein